MSAGANTSGKSEGRGYPVRVPRMAAMESAIAVLGGKAAVASALGITVRGLYDKRHGVTGISDAELRILLRDFSDMAARCSRIATNLLAELGEAAPAAPPTPALTIGASA